jgi:enediyne biosynthesis protein E4
VPPMTRRTLLRLTLGALGALRARALFAQGVSSHTTKPLARPAPSGRPFNARLVDVSAAAGLREPIVYGGIDAKKYIVETIGCGCAFFDYDNDGWMDIFLLGGTRLEGDPQGASNRLYKNNRDGTFTDVTAQAGLQAVGWASGVCVGDYNNDGFEDLFCTFFGQNRLYRNNGDGTFTDVTQAAGLSNPQPRWGAGCSFLDYNRDGHLDLFVSNYVRFSFERAPVPGENSNCNWKGISVLCGPRGLPHGRHSLYRSNGDGTFTDVTEQAGISATTQGYGMTVVAADLDEDGWPDIYVACDSTPSLLFMNNRDGTFREEGVLRGVALSDDGGEQAGMGVGIGDFDSDGHLDLLKTHFADDASGLYHNDGNGQFDDVTRRARVAVETRYVGWGAGIVDLDNDGHPDLFVVTGSVYPEVERKLSQYPNKTPRAVFRNLGNGTFEELVEEAGPGVAATHCSRGCAFGDFDNDGDVDVLIVNLNEPPSLLRNDVTGSNNWLKVRLVGVASNRSAIGARVILHCGGRTQA